MTDRSLRIFRLSLGALPAAFRHRFAAAMEEAFLDGLDERSRAGRLWFTVTSVLNVLLTAGRERVAPSTRRPGPGAGGDRPRVWAVAPGLFLQDLRYAFRSLRRQPGFAGVIVVILALGIGANTAIFSVIDGVLLRPLPFAESDGLVVVGAHGEREPTRMGRMSKPNLEDVAALDAFRHLVGYSTTTVTLTDDAGEPRVLRAARVTDGMLSTFLERPLLGRDLSRADNAESGPRVAVVSHRFWQDELGATPDAVGRTITLSENRWTVVGVAPPGFAYPDETDIWIPHFTSEEGCGRGCHTLLSIGRLHPEATPNAVQPAVTALATRLAAEYPESNFGLRFAVRSLHEDVVHEVAAGLWVVLGAVGLVLLIACANVAILLLVRANAREGEMAVRTALGASGRRLLTQLLTESQVLAWTGAGLGVAGAFGAISLLRRYSADTIPRIDEVAIDARVLLISVGTTLVVALLFGLAPGLALSRRSVAEGLRGTGRGAGSRPGDSRLRGTLLAAEVALSVLLLTGSGLLLKTFVAMYEVDLGYETRRAVRFTVSIPSARYETLEQVTGFYTELHRQIDAMPGVAASASVYGAPLGRGNITGDVLVSGRPEPAPGDQTEGSIKPMTPGYLDVMGIPLLRGRAIAPGDRLGTRPVAVVNERFVEENFPDEDPIGQRVRITASFGFGSPEWTIVGVAGNIRSRSLTREPVAEIYVPHAQFGPRFMTVTARGVPGGPPLVPELRRALRAVDPRVPMRSVETMDEAVQRQLAPTRFYLMLVGSFAALAVVLSAVGLYGVVAYLGTRRTREIGIRLALGAARPQLARLIATQGLRPVLVGIAVGAAASIAASRALDGLLYEVEPTDPAVLVTVTALILVISLAAAIVPAGRATRVDPVTVMRAE